MPDPNGTNVDAALEKDNEAIEKLQGLLQKAGGSSAPAQEKDTGNEDKEKGDDYDPEYMAKYMKRYMKDMGKDKATSYMKDLGYMTKAMDRAFEDVEGALDDSDATLVDGTEFFKAFSNGFGELAKAVSSISERLETIEGEVGHATALNEAVGEVLVKAEKRRTSEYEANAKEPQPRQGVDVGPMQKAADPTAREGEQRPFLNPKHAAPHLLKATREGDQEAGVALSALEVSRGDLTRIAPNHRRKIEMIMGEVK